jgi:hypothetical protein
LPFSSGSPNSERVGNNYDRYYDYVNNRYNDTNIDYKSKSGELCESKGHCDKSGNAVGENVLSV